MGLGAVFSPPRPTPIVYVLLRINFDVSSRKAAQDRLKRPFEFKNTVELKQRSPTCCTRTTRPWREIARFANDYIIFQLKWSQFLKSSVILNDGIGNVTPLSYCALITCSYHTRGKMTERVSILSLAPSATFEGCCDQSKRY